jgi:hypothetical protein
MTAVTAATSAVGTPTTNPYVVGPFGWPGGGRNMETEETAADVILTGVPTGRKHGTTTVGADGVGVLPEPTR